MTEDLPPCREAFEKWLLDFEKQCDVYDTIDKILMLSAWQAAWNTRAPSPSSVTLPREVTDDLDNLRRKINSAFWFLSHKTHVSHTTYSYTFHPNAEQAREDLVEALRILEKHMGER